MQSNFNITISNANNIYKGSFKVAFILSFMLSFITEFCMIYLQNHGLSEFVKSQGQTMPSNFPSLSIIIIGMIIIMLCTIISYSLIVLVNGIKLKQKDILLSDAFRIALQILPKRILVVLGVFIAFYFINSILTLLLKFTGIFISVMLFVTVLPYILLSSKNIFEGLSLNLNIIKNNFLYMFKISLLLFILMLSKLLIIYAVSYIGLNNATEINLENIVIVFSEALVIPYILAISVSVYDLHQK